MGAVPVTKQQNYQAWPLVYLVTLAVVIVLIVMETIRSPSTQPSSSHADNEVTLRVIPGEATVPMSDGFAINNSHIVEQFAAGTRCTNLDGPLVITINDTQMKIYRLECNGRRGYVNAKWVNPD